MSRDPFKQSSFKYQLGDASTVEDRMKAESLNPTEAQLTFFALETETRSLVVSLIDPIQQRGQQDRIKLNLQSNEIKKLQERCYQLELIFDQNHGRNSVFDYIDERLNNHIIETKHQTNQLQEQISINSQRLDEYKLNQKSTELKIDDLKKNLDQVQVKLQDLKNFCFENRTLQHQQFADFEHLTMKDINSFKTQIMQLNQNQQLQLVKINQDQEFVVALQQMVNSLQVDLVQLSKTLSRDFANAVTKSEFNKITDEYQQEIRQIQYNCTDIRNMNYTTDQFVDTYLPFKLLKEMTQLLCFIFQDDNEAFVQRSKVFERNRMKELYTHLCQQSDDKQMTQNFKNDLIKLQDELHQKFSAFDINKKQKQTEQDQSLIKIQLKKKFSEIKQASSPMQLIKAIEIMAGPTDINPELTFKIKKMEEQMQQCYLVVDEMRNIVKKTLDLDGDLNVTQVKKELSEIKLWLKIQTEQEKKFWQAYTNELNLQIQNNVKKLAALEIALQLFYEESNAHRLKQQTEMETFSKFANDIVQKQGLKYGKVEFVSPYQSINGSQSTQNIADQTARLLIANSNKLITGSQSLLPVGIHTQSNKDVKRQTYNQEAGEFYMSVIEPFKTKDLTESQSQQIKFRRNSSAIIQRRVHSQSQRFNQFSDYRNGKFSEQTQKLQLVNPTVPVNIAMKQTIKNFVSKKSISGDLTNGRNSLLIQN